MTKGFWDFMSDWMKSPALRYFEFDDEQNNKSKLIEIGKKDYKLIRGER